MHPARRQALALASASLRRASGAGASTSSSTGGSGGSAAGSGGLSFSFDRSKLSNQSLLFARGFASRRPKVSVLLKEDVEGLGEAGTEASVRPGYARNALLPRGAAELVPHRRARRADRPPRSVLQERLRSEEEAAAAARKESSSAEAVAAASASAEAAAGPEQGAGVDGGGGAGAPSSSALRLVAVARSLSRGALEFVRPLRPEGSGSKGENDSSSSYASSPGSGKIAEPIDAEAFAAAVASQKRIALDPRLVMLESPIDEQGEHFVSLRMRLGGERVVVRALVGLAAAAGGAGGDEKKGGKKKGGRR